MEGGGALASGEALLCEPAEGLARELRRHLLVPKLLPGTWTRAGAVLLPGVWTRAGAVLLPGVWMRAPAVGGSMWSRGQRGDAKRLPAKCDDAEEA